MNKVLYVVALILSWFVLVFSIASLLIFMGIIPMQFNWSYTYGTAVAIPSMWLLFVGIVMLLRQFFYKVIFGTNKPFNKSIATILIVIGTIWFAFTIGGKLIHKSTTEKLFKTYENTSYEKTSTLEYNYNTKEDVIKDIEKQYIAFCKDMNSQLPIRIDEITTLNSVLFSNWNISFHYYVEIDVNDYYESDLKDFMSEIKASQKQQISNMFINGEYDLTQEDFRELCKHTGLKFRFVYFDINRTMIGANVFDYSDF